MKSVMILLIVFSSVSIAILAYNAYLRPTYTNSSISQEQIEGFTTNLKEGVYDFDTFLMNKRKSNTEVHKSSDMTDKESYYYDKDATENMHITLFFEGKWIDFTPTPQLGFEYTEYITEEVALAYLQTAAKTLFGEQEGVRLYSGEDYQIYIGPIKFDAGFWNQNLVYKSNHISILIQFGNKIVWLHELTNSNNLMLEEAIAKDTVFKTRDS